MEVLSQEACELVCGGMIITLLSDIDFLLLSATTTFDDFIMTGGMILLTGGHAESLP